MSEERTTPGGLVREGDELHFKGGKERYIIIPLRAYAEIINSFASIVGEAVGGPLTFLGKRIGYGLVEELQHRLSESHKQANVENLVREYAKFLSELGFGKIEVKEVGEDHAIVYMHSPPSMDGIRVADDKVLEMLKKGKKICYLEAGMIAGVFEKIIGGKFRAFEVERGDLENPYCVIRVEKVG